MKSFTTGLIIFLMINITQAKNLEDKTQLRWGYIDAKGKMVIKPQFEEIDLYGFASNGMSAFKQNEKWGYIDTKGKIVIKPQFKKAYQFSSYGLAIIEINNDDNQSIHSSKSGYIDSMGNIVIKPQFEKSYDFQSNGLAVFEQYYRIEKDPESLKDGAQNIGFNTTSGLIDSAGNVIVKPVFHSISNFGTDGLSVVVQKDTMRNGIIDSKGKILFWLPKDFSFTDEAYALNGSAKISRHDGTGNYDKNCYVNKTGTLVGCEMESIDFGRDATIGIFQQKGKYGYMDTSGKVLIKAIFDEAEPFDKYDIALVKNGNGWGYINKTGEFAIKEQFEFAIDFYDNDLAAVKKNGLWGYINRRGEMTIEPKFDDANAFHHDSGLAKVINNGKLGYINKNGKMVISTNIESNDCCDKNHFITKYVASFEEHSRIGLMDNTGKVIIPPFHGDVNVVGHKDTKLIIIRYDKNGKYAYLNEKGKMIIEPVYDYIDNQGNPYMSPFSDDDIAMVIKNNLYGYIDINGNIIAKPQFKNASKFENGFAAVLSKQ